MGIILRKHSIVTNGILIFLIALFLIPLNGCYQKKIKKIFEASKTINFASSVIKQITDVLLSDGLITTTEDENIKKLLFKIDAANKAFISQAVEIRRQPNPLTEANRIKMTELSVVLIKSIAIFQQEGIEPINNLEVKNELVKISAAFDYSIASIVQVLGCEKSGNCLVCEPGSEVRCPPPTPVAIPKNDT